MEWLGKNQFEAVGLGFHLLDYKWCFLIKGNPL
jgi:hypothetical protein